ncbi:MAG: hypothetical protein WCD38_11730 [Candidatus Tumulicola sp.]
MTTETKHVYTSSEIDEQLAEAKTCKVFIDILNGDTSCLAVTPDALNGMLNRGLSAAVRLGEIVEQLREDREWLAERGVLDRDE